MVTCLKFKREKAIPLFAVSIHNAVISFLKIVHLIISIEMSTQISQKRDSYLLFFKPHSAAKLAILKSDNFYSAMKNSRRDFSVTSLFCPWYEANLVSCMYIICIPLPLCIIFPFCENNYISAAKLFAFRRAAKRLVRAVSPHQSPSIRVSTDRLHRRHQLTLLLHQRLL